MRIATVLLVSVLLALAGVKIDRPLADGYQSGGGATSAPSPPSRGSPGPGGKSKGRG